MCSMGTFSLCKKKGHVVNKRMEKNEMTKKMEKRMEELK